MSFYRDTITLSKNDRGIWDLDPSKGCASGLAESDKGCYDECYAAKGAKIYGREFNKTVLRYFKGRSHLRQIIDQINEIDMPFIRMGCSGDPSENWEHTFSILEKIKHVNEEIVIITKHWNLIPDLYLDKLKSYNVCINTSVSALDNPTRLTKCLSQYNRLKPYCKSALRIVSCDFNTDNPKGLELSIIQESLFKNDIVIDTVFRVSKDNQLIKDGIIKVKNARFMKGVALVSKYNRKTYFGKCGTCKEKCGVFDEKIRQTPKLIQADLFNDLSAA